MPGRWAIGAVCAIAAAAVAVSARGQSTSEPAPRTSSPRPMSLLELTEIPRIIDVQLSPDGRAVSYMLQRADWQANRLLPHIWRQTIGGSAPVQLTSGEAGEANARWSPDSRTLLYVTGAQNGAQAFLIPADGGAGRQLTRHATSISAPAWAADGSAIYFIAADAPSDAERERDRLRDGIF